MSKCKSCDAKIIWMTTLGGKKMPVDWTQEIEGDKVFDAKRHVSHFTTCKDAGKWRK